MIWIGLLVFLSPLMLIETMAASLQEASLERLLTDRDYLALEAQLNAAPPISDDLRRFYFGVLAERRNKLDEALRLLKPVLAKAGRKLSVAQKRIGLTALADCYVKQFRYREAEEAYSRTLRLLGTSLSTAETKELVDSRQLMVLLRDAPPQTAALAGAFEQPIVRNKIGLLEIPVTVGGRQSSWIFDSGANFSLVTRSVARELGIKMFPGRASVTRTGGVVVSAEAGLVPELAVGPAVFRNVVVLVVDDADFYIPQLGFQIQEILGYPVISAMQKISIAHGERLEVLSDKEPQAGTTSMWLDALTPLIALQVDDRPALFVLDLGARHSYLSDRYFDRHRNLFVDKSAGQMNFGGAGGARSVPAYSIAELSFQLGAIRTIMKNVPVAAADTHTVSDPFYGIVGQDFLSRFESFTLDFGAMTFSVGSPSSRPAR